MERFSHRCHDAPSLAETHLVGRFRSTLGVTHATGFRVGPSPSLWEHKIRASLFSYPIPDKSTLFLWAIFAYKSHLPSKFDKQPKPHVFFFSHAC